MQTVGMGHCLGRYQVNFFVQQMLKMMIVNMQRLAPMSLQRIFFYCQVSAVTMLPDCGRVQQILSAWKMSQNEFQPFHDSRPEELHCVCVLSEAMPSLSPDFRCCMFITMSAGQKL